MLINEPRTEASESESPAYPIVVAGPYLQLMSAGSLLADSRQKGWARYVKAIALIGTITLLGGLVNLRVAPTNLAMLYLLGTVFVSYRWGFQPAAAYALISTLTFDFFFIPPYESFAVTDFWYVLTAVTLLGIALVISTLISAVRRHAISAARREAHAAILYALLQSLACVRGSSEVLRAAAAQIRAVFGLDVATLLADEGGRLVTRLEPSTFRVDASVRDGAEAAFAAARRGRTRREGAFLPLLAGEEVIGVMVLSPVPFLPRSDADEDFVLNAMAGQVALAIKRSLLEEKAREAEREQAQARRAKAEAVATLAGGMAHNLNNLLTVILGNAGLVADSLAADHPARKSLGDLNTAGQRAARIVGQVLSYSGDARSLHERIDLSVLAGDFVENIREIPANIELRVTLDDHLPPIEGDRKQVLQLIGNLYLNAVDALDGASGKIVISTHRGQSSRPDQSGLPTGDCVCLTVTDTGCGIEESIRPRIFDPFFTTKFVGRGLGLSAAEGIMRAHNGSIRVSSEPGKGSVFTCLFAAARTGAASKGRT